MSKAKNSKGIHREEITAKSVSGMSMLILNIILLIISIAGVIFIAVTGALTGSQGMQMFWAIFGFVVFMLYACVGSPILFMGLKVIKPNEAVVLTLFGKYYGTLREAGFYFVNPFVTGVRPGESNQPSSLASALAASGRSAKDGAAVANDAFYGKKISLKTMTLNNEKQKINDLLGNPIIIGIVVIWKVTNTAKAVFNVDNYPEFLSIQCDSALRNIVRLYPYDSTDQNHEKSLRGSSQDISLKLKDEIQSKVDIAGLEIVEARITHLAYAPEIAAAMLQRQQASAIIDARQMIVEGAVGMVEMALEKLNENEIVALDEERKAAMVSNLLVVLCGNKDAQPIVNSGSIY